MLEIKQLSLNLTEQVRIYKELRDLSLVLQEAIKANKLPEIEAITIREEQLLLQAAQLEKERLLWAEQIGHTMGKAPEDITLAELAEEYPQLKQVRGEMDSVLVQLRDVHELNTQLLQQASNLVNFTVGLLTQQENTTYKRPGGKQDTTQNKIRLLDRSI